MDNLSDIFSTLYNAKKISNNSVTGKPSAMKVLLCFGILLAISLAEDASITTFAQNNILNLPAKKTFYTSYGAVVDLFTTDKEIRNILVPPSDYLSIFNTYHPDTKKHPLIYFNLYTNGVNDGVYLLKNKTATKIKDGTDSVADYPNGDLSTTNLKIYISSSDGIYTYDSKKRTLAKFGSITDDFRAIDKMSQKDVIFVLGADNKIYNITEKGTVKTKVEGIEYAKDFVLDLKGAIYFIGEDNKPKVLYRGSTTPLNITGLNFDSNTTILGRPIWDPFSSIEHTVPLIVDGVSYVLVNSSVLVVPCEATVPGLTGFSAEYSFVNFYGVNGQIYMHSVLADNPVAFQRLKSKAKKLQTVAFNRHVESDYKAFKELRVRQKKKKY